MAAAGCSISSALANKQRDQACRMNRKMTPGKAYGMKWHVCSVEKTLWSQSSEVTWRSSVHLQLKKPLFHEVSTWLWLTSSTGKWNTVEGHLQSSSGSHKAPHTCSPVHSTPLPVQSPLQGCPTHGGKVLQLQETFVLLCSPSAQNSHHQRDRQPVSLKQKAAIGPHRLCWLAACAQAVQTGVSM